MTLHRIFVLLICLVFSGCWYTNRSNPQPNNLTEYTPPIQKPFKFTKPIKFKWNTVPQDSIHPGHISYFDINKLPFRQLNTTGFVVMPQPPKVTPFSYRAIPDTVLNMDAIAAEPLILKTSVLGMTRKQTLSPPKLMAESYTTSFIYSADQGLPNKLINSIFHSKNGDCWISTLEGLCIVHGEYEEVLPYNYGIILFMTEDSQGRVWLASRQNGVFIIDRKAGIQSQCLFPTPFSVNIRIDKNGYAWITDATNGLYKVTPDLKTYQHLSTRNGLSSDHSIVTCEDRDGRIWVSNVDSGLDIIDPSIKKIKRFKTVLSPNKIFCTSMMEDEQGNMYVESASRGVNIINLGKETIKHIDSAQGLRKCFLKNMVRDRSGNIWMSADPDGVYILNKTGDSLAHLSTHEGLADSVVNHVDIDQKNQVFVATQSGINVFPPAEMVAHHISVKEGMLDKQVWGIFRDSKSRLWFGTYSGINIITPENKILQYLPELKDHIRFESFIQTGPDQFMAAGPLSGLLILDQAKHTAERIDLKEGLPSNDIFNIYQDSKGLIWMGSATAGLIVFDPLTRKIRYINQSSGLSFNRVNQFLEDSSGKMYVSTYGGGLDLIDLKETTICHYSSREGLSQDQIGGLIRDDKNRLWLSTENGIDLLDPAKQTNTIFMVANGLPSKGVYSLLQRKNTTIAGTGNGLVLIREKEKNVIDPGASPWELQVYKRSLGLGFLDFNGNTAALGPYDQFWWGIVEGTTMVNGKAFLSDTAQAPIVVTGMDIMGKTQDFTEPDRIQNVDTLWDETNDTFFLKGSFNKINADLDKGIRSDSLSPLGIPVNLSLPHDKNYLRFHFSHFLPQNNGTYKYTYFLDGVDEKWSPVTDQPLSENYNNISPGYYTFRVSVKKGLGPWSEPSVYNFRIRPPWWQSWWAELVYILVFVALVRFWVRYRSRRLIKENMVLEQKVAERTTALSASLENLRQTQGQLIQAEKMASLGELTAGIAHEIQNPLNFVNNFSEVNTELVDETNKAIEAGNIPEAKELLKDVEMNMEKITFHGKRADAIVKGMLLHSRASGGQKILANVNTLADEYLRLSYHGLRAKDKSFNAQFSMDLDEKMGEMSLVPQDIGRVFLNLFNNSFYSVTEKKKNAVGPYEPLVSVTTKRKKDSAEIRIRDNGLGIPKKVLDKIYQPFFTTKPAGQGTGLGLSLSYDIVTKEHGGKIDVVTKENEFTEFIIELPFLPL